MADLQGNATVIEGDVADGTADAGQPVKIGAKAVSHGAAPANVPADGRTDLHANRHGIAFVSPGHPNMERVTRVDTAAQTDVILKAVAAGEKWVTTGITVLANNANTVDVQALIEYDAVTDVRITEHPGVLPGGGFTEGHAGGMLAVGGDGEDLLWTCTVPTGGSIFVGVSGYIVPS